MLKVTLLSLFTFILISASAQVQTQVIGDSVFVHSNDSTGELILQNSTDTISGFLFNKGLGRTAFKRALVKINDSTYLIGADTLSIHNTNESNINAIYKTEVELYKTQDRSYTTAFSYSSNAAATISDTSIAFNSTSAISDIFKWNIPSSSNVFLHNYERWEWSAVVQFNSMTADDAGFYIGTQSTESTPKFEGFQIKAHPGSGSLLYVYFMGQGSPLTNGGSLAFNNGDNILVDAQRSRNTYTLYLLNQRSGATYTLSQVVDPSSAYNYQIPLNTSQFALNLMQGHYNIKAMRIVTYDGNADYTFVGNSITNGTQTSNYFNSFPSLVRKQNFNTTIFAGGGCLTSDVVNELPALLKIHPKRVVLEIGTNDLVSAIPLDTTKVNYTKIVNTLNSAGINTTLLSLTPRADADVRTLNTWIQTTFTTSQYIDIFTSLAKTGNYVDSSAFFNTDNLHPNDAGHALIAKTILGNIVYTPNPYDKRLIPTNLQIDGNVNLNNYSSGNNYQNDTTNYKPVVIDNKGSVFQSSWLGTGGNWSLTGNSGTVGGTNFIGTKDNVPINFRVNNALVGTIGTTSNYNVSFGALSLPNTSTGIKNGAIGGGALGKNTTGYNNFAIGYTTLYNNLTGNNNTGNGWAVMGYDSAGIGNTAMGAGAMNQSTTTLHVGGAYNSALGYEALVDNFNNKYNIGLGYMAGNASGSSNTFYISDSTYHMHYKLDSASGSAPNVIGKDASGFWHVYETPLYGTATLAAGTVTVSTVSVKTGAKIYVSVNTPGGTQGFLSAPAASIVNGTSFIINSTSATETSTVNWQIIN